MKKLFLIISAFTLFCLLSPVRASAAELKTAPILTEEDRMKIVALEENILSDLYNSSLSEKTNIADESIQSIDFNKAQKVYTFSPYAFLELVTKEDFYELYQKEGHVVWKVPVGKSANYYDYAIIGKVEDGEYTYTTVRTPVANVGSARYLFHPSEANDILSQKFLSTATVEILSIPMYDIDLLMVKSKGEISFIPYSDQTGRLRNGETYSPNELASQIADIVQENRTTADSGGGANALSVEKNRSGLIQIAILCAATCAAIYLFLKQWKAYRYKPK